MHLQQVREAYAAVADRYIELFGTSGQVHPDDLAFIRRHLARVSGTVLDLGCGPGHLTGYLRSLGVDATGIDVVPEFIAHAVAHHPGGKFRVGSMSDIEVAEGLLVWFSLIHVPPRGLDGALAGLRRSLAPAGTVVVGFFDGEEVAAFDHKVMTAFRWPVDEFSRRLTRAGFTEVDRMQRIDENTHRPLAAIAARASATE